MSPGPTGSQTCADATVLPSARGPGTTVSYLPIRPPKWAFIPSDDPLYPLPLPIRSNNSYTFKLQADSACLCPTGRSLYDPSSPTIFRTCKLYTLATVFEVELELQKCPTCPPKRRRYIGPDLREHGVFNYNNSILATHDLLDAYTSAYTTSETPFISWVTQTSRLYAGVDTLFMGSDLFRSVWFAYAYLQHFVGDMSCTLCKGNPDTVIWDGLTLAFGKKHLRDSIRPPTVSHPESAIRRKVSYQPRQQLLRDREVRKCVRDALAGPSVHAVYEGARQMQIAGTPHPSPSTTPFTQSPHSPALPSTPTRPAITLWTNTSPSLSRNLFAPSTPTPAGVSVAPTPPASPSKALLKQVSMVESHISRIKACVESLRLECPALASIFERYLGPAAYAKGSPCPPLWKNFFKQVGAANSLFDPLR